MAFNLPFLAWILVAFFDQEIHQLEEAARIDGATRFQAFYMIAVPVAAPGLLAAGLLAFILSWNEFLFALILSGKATAHPAGRARDARDAARRRDRPARRRHPGGAPAGVRSSCRSCGDT